MPDHSPKLIHIQRLSSFITGDIFDILVFSSNLFFNFFPSHLGIPFSFFYSKHCHDLTWSDLAWMSFLSASMQRSIRLILLGRCKTHTQEKHTYMCTVERVWGGRWKGWGQNKQRLCLLCREEKKCKGWQRMTERGENAERIVNGYLIPRESDRTSPSLQDRERGRKVK